LCWHLSRNRFDSPQQLVGNKGRRMALQGLPRRLIETVWEQLLQVVVYLVPIRSVTSSSPRFVADVRGLPLARVVLRIHAVCLGIKDRIFLAIEEIEQGGRSLSIQGLLSCWGCENQVIVGPPEGQATCGDTVHCSRSS